MNILFAILYILTYVLGIVGCWFVVSYFIVTPSKKAKKTIKAYTAAAKSNGTKTSSIDIMLDNFSTRFVKYVHINDIKRSEMSKALYISNNPKTPEEYMAYIYTVSGIIAIMGLISMIFIRFMGIGLLALAVITYVFNIRKLNMKKKEAIEGIEMELPRYTAYLKQAFKNNKNVLSVMEGYISDNAAFIYEMNQAIADAKTSNFNSAMARLDQRVNSDRMKMVIHGLISAFNGEEVGTYFAMLEKDFTSFEINILKKNIKTIPQKMQAPKILLFSSIFITLFLPLALEIVGSFRDIFMS